MKTNVLKTAFNKAALTALAVTGFAVAPAGAQNPNFAPGDLLLYFIQFGGSQTVLVNLGAAYGYRDATANSLNFINIGGTLTGSTPAGAAYPADWYDDPTMFWGLAAVHSNSTSTTAQVNGDPGRTIYVAASRTGVGTDGTAESPVWVVDSGGSMTTGSNGIIQMQNRLEVASVTNTLVEGTGSSFVDNQNLFNINGDPTVSFSVFPGGTMGRFNTGTFGTIGGETAEGALDLYRILATTAPVGTVVEPGNSALEGTYEGTFIISQTGSVSYIAPVPEPATVALLAGSAIFGLVRRRRVRNA